MRAPLIRRMLAFVAFVAAAVVVAALVAAEEPPSSPWSPPIGQSPPGTQSPPDSQPEREQSHEPTPALNSTAGELPPPQSEPDEPADDNVLFGAPWLRAENLIGSGDVIADDEAGDDATWYEPNYWFGSTPWDTGIELGLNGSSGNNEAFSIRTGGYMKRESRFSKLDYSLYYNRTTSGNETTQNNATTDIRNDWLLDDSSPWSLFTKANLFYDEFQAFDLQTNGNSGLGYQIFKDPAVNLTVRSGAGASREFGGPDNEWTPEALFGFEYEQSVNDTQKFFANFEYYPQLENFGEYRLVADGGWEIELSKPSNMSLKISANDRFDSTSFGADPNLVNYSVLLLLKL